jgi:acetolactate synthase-1/2/3 large subunit
MCRRRVISAKASEIMTRLAEKYQIPVVTTLMGIGHTPLTIL